MGRKPIFEKPMTQVERNRRYLNKLKSRAKKNISGIELVENKKDADNNILNSYRYNPGVLRY